VRKAYSQGVTPESMSQARAICSLTKPKFSRAIAPVPMPHVELIHRLTHYISGSQRHSWGRSVYSWLSCLPLATARNLTQKVIRLKRCSPTLTSCSIPGSPSLLLGASGASFCWSTAFQDDAVLVVLLCTGRTKFRELSLHGIFDRGATGEFR
jgi:hypothetical protein